jgi:hypothetical protein
VLRFASKPHLVAIASAAPNFQLVIANMRNVKVFVLQMQSLLCRGNFKNLCICVRFCVSGAWSSLPYRCLLATPWRSSFGLPFSFGSFLHSKSHSELWVLTSLCAIFSPFTLRTKIPNSELELESGLPFKI